ncbi:MAG: dockerin type I domain-containing protein [Planctomycetota bacterium]
MSRTCHSNSSFLNRVLIISTGLLMMMTAPAWAVTFTENTYIGPTDTTYDNDDIIVDGCTLTVDGAHPFNSLQIINSGIVTHSANADTQEFTLNLTIATDVSVDATSVINVSGRGFASSEGPGAGVDAPYAGGAGYGGRGGLNAYWTGAGEAYGVIAEPTDIGSGGGRDSDHGYNGGAGGGAVRLDMGGIITIEGQILANGANGTQYDAGGGSGGAIYVTASTLAGGGTVSAVGGVGGHASNAGCGAGGRIALYYDSSTYTGTTSAVGGSSNRSGAAGTIYTKAGAATGSLLIDAANYLNINRTPLDSQAPAADTVVTNGALVEVSEALTLASLDVDANCWLYPPVGTAFDLTVQNDFSLDPDAHVSANGHGYASSEGPGAGGDSPYASGGGHGGNGGSSANGTAGGGVYGSITEPTALGSGGGYDTDHGVNGGAGGGAIHVIVNGTFTCDGELSANGLVGAQYDAGGGAGGSIWIEAGTLAGAGVFHANGGPGSYLPHAGGGGGGRVAIYYDSSSFSGSVAAYGGAGVQYGGAGSIYTKASGDTYGTTLIDNAGNTGGLTRMYSSLWPGDVDFNLDIAGAAWVWADDAMTFVNLSIDTSAILSHEAGQNVFDLTVLEDATVTLEGTISADGCGHASQFGPGAGGDSSYASGAGHGGNGGSSANGTAGGVAYDSITDPNELGSGGGYDTDNGVAGGRGGGAIHLVVTGTLTLDGEITADGFNGANYDAGGGSGGTVNLDVGALAGTGSISADGGAGYNPSYAGGGGGGRIAVYYDSSSFSGSMAAYGDSGAQYGGAGSIYTKASGDTYGNTLIDNAGNAGGLTRMYSSLWPVDVDFNLDIAGAAWVWADDPMTFVNLSIDSGAILSHEVGQNVFDLTVLEDATVTLDGTISADGCGYASQFGPGAGEDSPYAGGAGYGGRGGRGRWGAGGVAYGSITDPNELGSGGGWDTDHGVAGGRGGGAIRLSVTGTLTLDGEVTADGFAGTNYDAGGGSGGTVNLDVGALAGTGSISADGGAGYNPSYAGGGGGGRIAVYHDSSTFSGGMTACGAAGTVGGGAGTIYTQEGALTGALTIDACGATNIARTPLDSQSPAANTEISGGAQVEISEATTLETLDVAGNSTVWPPSLQTLELTVNGNAGIEAGSAISADAHGFGSSDGPGEGGDGYEAGGGGYGGTGGAGSSSVGGGTYGSITSPTDFGSGGGYDTNNGYAGGVGGGAIKLTVGGVLTVDGAVTADGITGEYYHAGGGSGGSIWLDVATLAGSGAISANGGPGYDPTYAGGGGGGRVAIYCNTNSFVGLWSAYGGNGRQYGGAGTVYTKAAAETYGTVLIDNASNAGGLTRMYTALWPSGSVTFNLDLDHAAFVFADDAMTFASLDVLNVAQFSHEAGQNTFDVTVLGDATVDLSSFIHADARGFPSSEGPGAGTDGNEAGGGGYGGVGGRGYYGVTGGSVYGSIDQPADLGSGGGYDTNNGYAGGAGGGALKLTVGGVLTVDGAVTADGITGEYYHAGGGSGGSIWLDVATLAGSGAISANGGQGYDVTRAGGGGGGRVAIYYNTNSFAGSWSAYGANGSQYGGAGTIYTSGSGDPYAAVLIDNGGNAGGLTRLDSTLWSRAAFDLNLANACWVWVDDPVTFQNLSIDSQAVLSHEPRENVFNVYVLDDATVLTDGAISVNACGYSSSNGPGQGSDGNEAGGAGYGGAGGAGSSASGGEAYGTPVTPFNLGSGGGRDTNHGYNGGVGGGAILLSVNDVLTVDGIITANGTPGTAYEAGGGSGGGIALKAASIDGTGQITANGGAGANPVYAGGGAGGRIALFTCDLLMPLEQIEVAGGAGWENGEDGSVFVGSSSVEILAQPEDAFAFAGDPVMTFSVTATGDGDLSYQWRKGGEDLVDDGHFSGVTTDTLTITLIEFTDAGSYDVLVIDDCGAFPSNPATFIVPPPGDMNCDGVVNAYDIDGFICALSLQCDYEGQYPYCDRMLGDMNGDGEVNAYDIDGFIAAVGGG